jgi:hypothetical protein
MVAAEDGWPNTIHACKEDMKNKRLDEDKKQDSKEKETSCQVEGSAVFGVKNELAR